MWLYIYSLLTGFPKIFRTAGVEYSVDLYCTHSSLLRLVGNTISFTKITKIKGIRD